MSEWRRKLVALDEAVKARNTALAFSLVKQIIKFQPGNPVVRSLIDGETIITDISRIE